MTADVNVIVRDTIARMFNFPKDKLTAATTAADVPGWDSFSHGQLILELENRLDVQLPIEKLFNATNIGELVAIIGQP